MFAKPQDEHRWLEALVGEWRQETEALMGKDQPPITYSATVVGRMLGGLWLRMETNWAAPEHGKFETLITLGYDTTAKQYVGAFIGSMMTEQWIYHGAVDESQRRLTLDTTGPKMDGSGGRTQYQDIVTQLDADHFLLTSQVLTDDGEWFQFLTARHERVR